MARSLMNACRALGWMTMTGAALAGTGAWAGNVTPTQPSARADQAVLVAQQPDAVLLAATTGGADYDMGYRDGYNNLPYRDKDRSNKAYGDGFRAGEAKRQTGGTTSGGADYDLGYRDGYNKLPYRDKDRSNKAYGDGYKAGQAKLQTPPPVVAAPAAAPDYQLGFGDALNKRDYRDRDRSNKAYAEGYKAGQAKHASIVASGPDYELGYRDGFNKADYRDRDRSNKRYADGFKAGQTQREGAAAGAARPGLPPAAALPLPVRTADLIGRNTADLDAGMKSLGYTRRAGFTKGRETFSTWRGNTESQCVRVTVRNGKVAEMGDVEESNCL